ncbi:MAG: ABC transporter permease [Burkholderiales bacterium]|nr:ABC transporter permease [Burkholderiales bacterium]ODU67217.1 MAG: ABC transporter permease [Lautropia sp. SCN 66-9]
MESLLIAIVAATIVAGTPLVIVALGELIAERAGVLNLGAEGMMAVGAVAGFAAAHHLGSSALAMGAGLLAGMAVSLIFAFLVLTLMANQVACGLALAIFGVGLSAFVGKSYESISLPAAPAWPLPGLAELPGLGPALFTHQWPIYASWLLLAGVLWFLHKSRAGLALRAIGESPAAAHALGYPVIRIRYAATLFGGALAGAGGAFLSVFYTPLWAEGMIAGRGWIALALVVFATWRPWRVMLGAYLFGGVMVAQLFVQGSGAQIEVPTQLLTALPYLATIVVLVLISSNRRMIRLNSPASLGQAFKPDT